MQWSENEDGTITVDVDQIEIDRTITSEEGPWVYFIIDDGWRFCKIGRTVDLKKRLGQLQHASPMFLKIEHSIKVRDWKDAGSLEAKMHKRFSGQRVRGEWFLLEGELRKYLLS